MMNRPMDVAIAIGITGGTRLMRQGRHHDRRAVTQQLPRPLAFAESDVAGCFHVRCCGPNTIAAAVLCCDASWGCRRVVRRSAVKARPAQSRSDAPRGK